jgi:lipoprotein-anchoring transpeptidase ErfK/SrfK
LDADRVDWIDVLLLGGIVLAFAVACLVTALMAWQAPGVIRATYLVTPVSTEPIYVVTPTPSPEPTLTATAEHTATPPPHLAPATTTPLPASTERPAEATALPTTPAVQGKRIDIDLSRQTLTAYEGDRPVFDTLISAGLPHTPTPIGTFAIYSKVRSQTMRGPDYSVPNVQFVSFFHKAYAIHGAYWHNNFGRPVSHGCVNMRNADAEWVFAWAPIGTPVQIHD